MRYGAFTLSDATTPRIEIECDQCGRRGSYSTARLLEQYGPDVDMPSLKSTIVLAAGCTNHNPTTLVGCKAKYSAETVNGWLLRE